MTGLGIIYFRPEILISGGNHILEATLEIEDALGILLLAIGWIAIFDSFIRYRSDRLVALNTQLKNLLKATSVSTFWLMIVSALFTVRSFNILNILIFFLVVTAIGIVSRLFLRVLLLSARKSGYNYRYLLVIGANGRARQIAAQIDEKPELGYKIVGFVAETPDATKVWDAESRPDWKILGLLENLRAILIDNRVDEVIVCLPMDARFSDIALIVRHARDLGIVVRLMPDLADGTLLRNLHVEEFENEHVVTLFREQMLMQLLMKRLLDTALSLVVLIILAPVMLVVAILIKLTSPGPVFFVQDRVGMNQRRFKLYKFRSMVVDAEERKRELAHLNEQDGPAFKIKNDPRITRIGRFIRKTSIDELPQLFNIIKDQMSWVGPRPIVAGEVPFYKSCNLLPFRVMPGATGLWQISGRNETSYERRVELDVKYVTEWSYWRDIKILAGTIPAVLSRRGAY
jgi:exopolysaccharide biosynthesis polyprenyl glycosylphosphotransferase